MRIAVSGVSGFIGRALADALHARGDEVVAFSRHADRAELAWPPEPGRLPAVDAIVHLAGETVAGRWTEAKMRAIRASRVDGTHRLVDAIAAAEQRPKALICASAVGIYGDRGEEIITETSPPGTGFLAEVCQQWEAEAARAEDLGVRVAMVRTGIVLGRGGALAQMLPLYRRGLGGPMGSGRQWFPWIHIEDAVGVYLFLLEGELSGPVNATAPEPARQIEFARCLAALLGRPALMPTPRLALKLLYGGFADTLFHSQRVLPQRAQGGGYAFRYPSLTSALRSLLTEAG